MGESVTFTIQPQASVTIIDQSTGQVKALVGGPWEKKTASKTLNRAADVTRQPGSTFKILTAYAPALDSGSYTLATTVLDEPITYSSGPGKLHNADGKYRGLYQHPGSNTGFCECSGGEDSTGYYTAGRI